MRLAASAQRSSRTASIHDMSAGAGAAATAVAVASGTALATGVSTEEESGGGAWAPLSGGEPATMRRSAQAARETKARQRASLWRIVFPEPAAVEPVSLVSSSPDPTSATNRTSKEARSVHEVHQ